jgi:hypothetical protein
MPYKIEPVKGGFKVCDSKRCFSKGPLTKRMATKQRVAIALSEHRKKPNKSIGYFFA